ncbi:MAG: hypothetical protein Hyperionvirus45_7 [Hyperionvirus sp.]|uniref:Uncharacterized protein n=1 Tax=Hyperionvirus sp. TaxID=2487770 RepID=A0A3G5AC88_9VIRU|nr:MAG: hypothetical protein Hyperionvirus45_7 [Hyperionvirus sp.]
MYNNILMKNLAAFALTIFVVVVVFAFVYGVLYLLDLGGNGGCSSTSDCAYAAECLESKCIFAKCTTNADCKTPGSSCTDGRCIVPIPTECNTDNDCLPPKNKCSEAICIFEKPPLPPLSQIPLLCSSNDDCTAPTTLCSAGKCILPNNCTTDADCTPTPNTKCYKNTCVYPCSPNSKSVKELSIYNNNNDQNPINLQ